LAWHSLPKMRPLMNWPSKRLFKFFETGAGRIRAHVFLTIRTGQSKPAHP
jgi:hypothetical protein